MSFSQQKNGVFSYILFAIWPFLAVFIALFEYRQTWAKNIIWLFVVFYGYTMVLSVADMDASRYRDEFIEVANSDGSGDIIDVENTNNVDLLKPLLNHLVSSFTDNYKILFMVYGAIFGFFYSRNIWLLLENSKHKIAIISIPILIVFVFVNPFWNINGFRFWTAAQIFVYGMLLFLLKKNKKGLWLVAITPFIHFSFLFPLAIVAAYIVLGNRVTLYFYLFVASLFISELNLESVRENLNEIVPSIFQRRIDAYIDEGYREVRKEELRNANWYVEMRLKLLKYSVYAFLILIYWRERHFLEKRKGLFRLFCFILLFLSFANVISSIPSASRFIIVSFSFATALIFINMQYLDDKVMHIMTKISIPALLIFLVVTIRMGFDTMSMTTVFGNPLIALFMENDIPLINLIK